MSEDNDRKECYLTFRLTKELHDKVKEEAKRNTRSIGGQVLHYVRLCLENNR